MPLEVHEMIGHQVEDVIALAPNGNIKEQVQASVGVGVGETSMATYVSRIEVKFQKTIDTIEEQEIVVHGQENANGDVETHVQID
jgi:hypothetical protein